MPDDGPWTKYAAPAGEDGPWAKYGGSKTTEAEQVAQRPDAIAQARAVKPAGLLGTRRAMQQTIGGPPMFVDVPAGEEKGFESAGRRGYATGGKAGMASLALPSLVAAPVPTALSLLGGAAGGYLGSEAGRRGAEAFGADPQDAEAVGDVGGVLGGVAGGVGASKLPSSRNELAGLLRNPATARQSQLGRPGSVKSILPSALQKYAVPEGLVPKGDVGTPTNPGPFMDIPSRLNKAQVSIAPDPFTGESKVTQKLLGPTGSAQKPLEPLIWSSPEEATAHDARMLNLQRQAKSAGMYHAAQGAAGKRLNLQQRIGKNALPFFPDE